MTQVYEPTVALNQPDIKHTAVSSDSRFAEEPIAKSDLETNFFPNRQVNLKNKVPKSQKAKMSKQ